MMSLALVMAACGSVSQNGSTTQNGSEPRQVAAVTEAAEGEPDTNASVEEQAASTQNTGSQSEGVEDVTGEVEVESAVNVAAEEKTSPVPVILPKPENKLAAGEYSWSQLLPRDGIRPIYEDEVEFVEAKSAPYDDNELVIGVEINGEAKAYAIGPLNSREMVNDTVGGVPIRTLSGAAGQEPHG